MKNCIYLGSLCFFLFFQVYLLQAQDKILVAAASDLKFALDSVLLVYQQHNPSVKIQVTYGSSGKFFEQIQHGAPFDMYFSADKEYPQKLREKGFAASEVRIYGIGRIVLWSKRLDPNKAKMNSLLDNRIKKIAIANPEHAPYGERAKESMMYYGSFDKVSSKLVYGENISQTAQFVQLGAADLGIVALSLALSPNMKKSGGLYYIIPEESHQPLQQGYVILKRGSIKQAVVQFYNFIASAEAIQILNHFGFSQQ